MYESGMIENKGSEGHKQARTPLHSHGESIVLS